MKKNNILEHLKKFWNYIWHDDSIGSYILNFLVAFIFIKYIFFPSIGFVLNNDYPIVAIVSGSMEHKIAKADNEPIYNICGQNFLDVKKTISLSYDEYWKYCGSYYEKNFKLQKDKFKTFDYKNGLNIGDVMVLYGKDPQKIEVGEILVFVPGDKNWFASHGPVIHRVVKKWQDDDGKYHFQTKGDHNGVSAQGFESDIPEDDVIGTAVLRLPYIGYVKILMSKALMGFMSFF